MFRTTRHTLCGMLLLLIMPVAVWLSGWHWQPGGNDGVLKGLFWLTETVTRPWGILTSVLLSAWMLWCLRFRLKPALLLLLIMNATIMAGQYTKSYIKAQIQEPRPYVIWLEQHHGLNQASFYAQKRQQRSENVTALIADETAIPGWLKRHWAFETGYAFPSGHTLFAASWALLALGLLWPRRHYKTVAVIFLWAIGVMASRLMLGMHWPRDLVVATLLSGLLVTLATWLVQRICGPLTLPPAEQKAVTQREP